jgi:hypothetical protein
LHAQQFFFRTKLQNGLHERLLMIAALSLVM